MANKIININEWEKSKELSKDKNFSEVMIAYQKFLRGVNDDKAFQEDMKSMFIEIRNGVPDDNGNIKCPAVEHVLIDVYVNAYFDGKDAMKRELREKLKKKMK